MVPGPAYLSMIIAEIYISRLCFHCRNSQSDFLDVFESRTRAQCLAPPKNVPSVTTGEHIYAPSRKEAEKLQHKVQPVMQKWEKYTFIPAKGCRGEKSLFICCVIIQRSLDYLSSDMF